MIDDESGKALGFFRNARHPLVVDEHSLRVIFTSESGHKEKITKTVARHQSFG
jgi:hypothetical protein